MLARLRQAHRDERGQMFILMILAMTLVLLIGVLVVDFGFWFSGRASVVNATDQATMSGSLKLPSDGAGAAADAISYLQENDPDVDLADISVSFRCIVGDRDHDGFPDQIDIPAICPQLTRFSFTCSNVTWLCYAPCEFNAPNAKCNTIVTTGSKDVPFGFADTFGLSSGNATGFTSAACRGSCGEPPVLPLDIVMFIDRTDSMSSSDLQNAKNGALAVLELFDPEIQHVALGVIWPSSTTSTCTGANAGGLGIAANSNSAGTFLPVGLSSDYKNSDGTLNTNSLIVKTINCLTLVNQPGIQTDLGDPLAQASDYLQNNGRSGVKKGMIFMTDGEANLPAANNTGQRFCTAQQAVTVNAGDNNGYESNFLNACPDGGTAAVDDLSGTNNSTTCSNTGKDKHIFYNFNANGGIPLAATIQGIEVRLDAWATSGASTRNLCVELSWNNGVDWSSPLTRSLSGSTEATYLFGGPTNNWGHAWSVGELSNANFQLRVTDVSNSSSSSTRFNLDAVAVNVSYTDSTFRGPCDYAEKKAEEARAAEIEIFTIGYGVGGGTCESTRTGGEEGTGSPYEDITTTHLLADMAMGTLPQEGFYDDGGDGFGGLPAGCNNQNAIDSENADNDRFLCEARDNDLAPVFRAAAEALAGGSRLIKFPPGIS